MQKQLTLRQRIKAASAVLAGNTKEFIPSLGSIDNLSADLPLANYATKPEQLRANIGMVYAANSAIVDPIVSVELKLGRRNKDGDLEEIKEHPILDLLDNPSTAHDGEALRTLHHTYRNLVGESYLLLVKGGAPFEVKRGELPDAIQVLPAHIVDFKLDKTLYSKSKVKYGQTEYKLGEVIRDFEPNPGNLYHGQSIVAAAAASIDVDDQMQAWNRRMFKNNARPGLIFNLTGDNIDPDAAERLKQQLEALYTSEGVFRSLVVENGDVKPYMLSQHDLDFLASREFTQAEILALFKVPAAVLGMIKDFNRANMDAARYIHTLNNVVPRLRKEVRMWNNWLVKKFDPNLELYFENPVPEDVQAKLAEAEKGVNTWMTIDEAREERGLPALPDNLGAQLYVPFNTVPLPTIATSRPKTPEQPAGNETNEPNPDDGDDEVAPEGKKGHPKTRPSAARK